MSPARNPESDFSLSDNSTPTPLAASVPAPTPTRRAKRLGIFVTPDGQLDATKANSPEDIERIRIALAIKAPEPLQPIHVSREFIPQMYSLLEVGIQQAGRLLLKWPPALANEMYFSEEKKKELVEPTGAVLDKYAPKWLVSNQEVAALAMALSSAVHEMVTKGVERYALKVAAAQQAAAPPPQPVNGHAVQAP